MSKFFNLLSLLVYMGMGSVFVFASTGKTKEYSLKSGVVIYSIEGGGLLAKDLNLTIVGEGKLRFKAWGKIALVEEQIEESTSGAFENTEKFIRCIKYDKHQQFNVNYDKEVILERPIPRGRGVQDLTKDMLPHGSEIIAGRVCELWAKEGTRVCLYEGIPLLVEKELFGISFEKKALWIEENSDVETDQCSIPNFPIRKIALFKTTIQQKRGISEVSTHLSEILDEVSKKSSLDIERHKQYYLNRIGEPIFEREKILLPQILESMKYARECLQKAGDRSEANECIEMLKRLKAVHFSEKEGAVDVWDRKEKNRILEYFDENITMLEAKMKCIRAAKNISDLSGCMRQ